MTAFSIVIDFLPDQIKRPKNLNYRSLFKLISFVAFIPFGHLCIYFLIESEPHQGVNEGIGQGLAFIYLTALFALALLLFSVAKLVFTLWKRRDSASAVDYLYIPISIAHTFILLMLLQIS